MTIKKFNLIAGILLVTGVPIHSFASCGAAFCTVNTNWNSQGVWNEPGGRFDLRYEFIDQDQPRTGTRRIGVGEIRQHHDEQRTLNRNLVAGLDYTMNDRWSINASLPFVSRSHSHIHNHQGHRLSETWSFREPGDVRVMARRQLGHNPAQSQITGITFGMKLPTGRFNIKNGNGDTAERSLQPGTGTTDALLGAYYHDTLGKSNSNWFAQVLYQQALNYRDNYKPGRQLSFDLGWLSDINGKLGWMIQLNTHIKGHDHGSLAEPANSGGVFVFASPGLSISLSKAMQAYAFLQLPVYQRVHGVQLTADWSMALGISTRF